MNFRFPPQFANFLQGVFWPKEHSSLAAMLLKWTLLGTVVGIVSGSASALFLASLEYATVYREKHPFLLFALPLAGLAIGLTYARWGKEVESGNNLLLERIHMPGNQVPLRMAPLILGSTVITHLFGGSAGREGTAVQMGGTLADFVTHFLRLTDPERRLMLMAGISGGFGSVFGTPLAGAVFGMEVLTMGRIGYAGLIPCFVASVVGDLTTRRWGIHHIPYPAQILPPPSSWLWLHILGASALFALAGILFVELTHAVRKAAKRLIPLVWLRPVAGGLLLIGLTYLAGSRDYLGLSLPLIVRSFSPEGVLLSAFAWKLLFTGLTLGTGFKGGEVTPLFCIGATLGFAYARVTGQPTGFFAALGLAAVFAGAANTPLACTILGIELFGASIAVPLAAACLVSYILSGHRGIYLSQRMGESKSLSLPVIPGTMLRNALKPAEIVSPKKEREGSLERNEGSSGQGEKTDADSSQASDVVSEKGEHSLPLE